MSGSITVPGSKGIVSLSATFDNSYNAALANQIAGLLNVASQSGSLVVTSVSGGKAPAAPTPGKINELLIGSIAGGQLTVPSGGSQTVVVVTGTQPLTIHGGANVSIIGGSGTW